MDFAGFQNPWALSLLPLAAVPWLLHLLRRRSLRKVPFPSLMLLAERRNVVFRRYRLEEILLLAVRTLLVLAAVAALARPLMRGGLPGWLSLSDRWAVIILDDSASMAATDGRGTAMELAKRKLAPVLEGMGPGARVAVVSGGRGTPMLAGFGSAAAAARAVRQASPRPVGTDLPAALALAGRMLEGAKWPSIIIASDFQSHCLDKLDPSGLKDDLKRASIALVDAGLKPPPGNLTWLAVKTMPLRGRMAVEGRYTTRGRAMLVLQQGGRVVNRIAVWPDSAGYFAAGMELPRGDSVFLKCPEDGLALDDTFFLGGAGAGAKRCLVIAGAELPGQELLGKALESLAGAGFTWVRSPSPRIGDLRKADVVVVASPAPDGQLSQALSRAAEEGTGWLIVPPADADPESYNRLLSAVGSTARLRELAQSQGQPQRLTPGPLDPGNGWDARTAEAVKVFRFWRTASSGPPSLTVGGLEAAVIFEETKRGRVALWLSGIDPSMSDLAYRPAFPVLLHRSLEYAGEWCPKLQYEAGDTVRLGRNLAAGFTPPGGAATPADAAAGAGERWLARPGWYLITGPAGRRLIAANLPSEESDLEQTDLSRLKQSLGAAVSEPGGRVFSGEPRPAWRAMLALALLLLAAEAGLRMRLSGQKNG